MQPSGDSSTLQPRAKFWREWPLWAVLLLVTFIYFMRIDHLTIRGEESRRATVAMEMMASGDWLVPRQQGETRFMSSRPPLQNWLIAAVATVRGELDTLAVRLPSVLAIALIATLLYAYGRTFMSPVGACAAAAGYVSMGQVMELGRLGETDALFTLFLSSALLFWHWGYRLRWPAWRTWTTAYACLALATLTKGPQAPVYFAGGVGLFLLWKRDWRYAVTTAHLAGIALFAAIFSAWFVPFALRVGWEGVRHTISGDVLMYVEQWARKALLRHYTRFPAELVGSLLPWSILLVAYLFRPFRQKLGSARSTVAFLWCVVGLAVPTVALVPGTRTRFLMSIFPCLALLTAVVVERAVRAAADSELRKKWRAFVYSMAIGMGALGVGLPIAKWLVAAPFLEAQPWVFVLAFSWLALGLGLCAWQCVHSELPALQIGSILCVASFVGLTFAGLFTNSLVAQSQRADLAMSKLKSRLPSNAQLVSVGPIHHLFAYHFGRPIGLLPADAQPDAEATGGRYFCTMKSVPISVPYEKVAEICCDREKDDGGRDIVIVGRLLTAPRQAKAKAKAKPLR